MCCKYLEGAEQGACVAVRAHGEDARSRSRILQGKAGSDEVPRAKSWILHRANKHQCTCPANSKRDMQWRGEKHAQCCRWYTKADHRTPHARSACWYKAMLEFRRCRPHQCERCCRILGHWMPEGDLAGVGQSTDQASQRELCNMKRPLPDSCAHLASLAGRALARDAGISPHARIESQHGK